MRLMIFGRRNGKQALLEWAKRHWQDWQTGVTEYWISDAEYPVCPVCWHRHRIAENDADVLDSPRRLWILINTAPPMEGPFDPGGWRQAEGCRCWRGYPHSASLHSG